MVQDWHAGWVRVVLLWLKLTDRIDAPVIGEESRTVSMQKLLRAPYWPEPLRLSRRLALVPWRWCALCVSLASRRSGRVRRRPTHCTLVGVRPGVFCPCAAGSVVESLCLASDAT